MEDENIEKKEEHSNKEKEHESKKTGEVKHNEQSHEHKTHEGDAKIHAHTVKKVKKASMWKVISGVLAILLLLSIFSGGFGGKKETVLTAEEAGQKAVDYINENLMQPGVSAKINGVEENDGVYNIKLDIGGREYDSYVTKDGGLLFPSGVDLNQAIENPVAEQPQAENIEKSDKPTVELFVMTHCPYGTQAEKGMIPVFELLGDKIDSSIRFVHYFMHGDKEEQESYTQVCIREEQSSKYTEYLKCFLEDENSTRCIGQIKIDESKLNTCIASKSEGYYAADSELSQGYGVQGSPTFVLNGVQAQGGRDSASYLAAVCSAFNTPPEECKETLSSQSPSPGFGYSVSTDTATGSC